MGFLQKINILPRWVIALLDGIVLSYAILLGFLLRFNFEIVHFNQVALVKGVVWFILTGCLSMIITKSYMGIVRHTSVRDGLILSKMIGINFLLLTGANIISYYLLDAGWIISFAVLMIASGIALFWLILYRMVIKELFGYIKKNEKDVTPIVVFGAGEAGILAQSIFANDNKVKKRVVAFLDDDINKAGKKLSGAKIYMGLQMLPEIVQKYNVQELVISVQKLSSNRKRQIIDECLSLGIHATIIPPVNEWINGSLMPNGIREVKIEDLLSRESIDLDNSRVKEDLFGKVVLVSGAAGSIGSELVQQIAHYQPEKVIMLDQSESALYNLQQEMNALNLPTQIVTLLGDIRKRKSIAKILTKYRPQIIYHAAAYKHVPMMEAYPEEAVKCNILGTKNLADLAVSNHVEKFVMISTDKAVNPTNVMGASKRIAEMYVQSLNDALEGTGAKRTKFVTTRFGNVLGSNGSVIPLFKNQIQRGGPVTVTHPDITRYFMTIPEACQLVLEAGVMGNGGEIFVFDMGEPVKIVDLAKKMIKLSGKVVDRDIKIEFSGLRQGEKLYEELLNVKEEVVSTHHPKIMIAKVSHVHFESIVTQIDAFKLLLKKNSDVALVSHMKTIVPEYISNASRFSFLDHLEVKH
ncbi:polysaccharide biosynthesis protein [Anditalea andensis]|uniref:Polysaccharide biosynthesis protein n=1 Tax=Anditalea andensis TaxID=1048983 RepID=A0A074L633_9BACT|nr:nucleoside-diphosphate sugar epimerase/dehydratase [Anditalea andensis]KEO75298.1 polysaccharide biosynthesis protein [Anditalea andensis]